jgi:hypothetical protein
MLWKVNGGGEAEQVKDMTVTVTVTVRRSNMRNAVDLTDSWVLQGETDAGEFVLFRTDAGFATAVITALAMTDGGEVAVSVRPDQVLCSIAPDGW